jgi:hypothetical protein
MSLRLVEEMIFSLRARGCVKHVGFYMTPYIQARVVSVGSSNIESIIFNAGKNLFAYWITAYVRVV